MLTSNNSLSGDSTKSSGSSSDLGRGFRMCIDDEKGFSHTMNGDYVNINGSEKDDIYWERRRKNNAAAKRSRERRRQHDMELEQQISKLKSANSALHKELVILRERLALNEALKENHDISSIYLRSINDVSTVQLFPNVCKSECLVSPQMSLEDTLMNSTENFTIVSSDIFEPVHSTKMPNCMSYQNPLDLSCKVKTLETNPRTTIKDQPKTIQRSNTQVTLDQKYWDRRRRNNEAVRKCRQNKRARIINSLKANKADNEQIQIKIETISSELEKIKSHFKSSETPSYEFSTTANSICATEMCEKEVPKYLGSKVWKWKTKLIEADQADKEMY